MKKLITATFALVAFAAATPASAQVVFDQLPANPAGATSISSQDFEPAYNDYDSAVLDDFTIGSITDFTSLDAILQGFNGGDTAGINSYTVNIYSSAAQAGATVIGDIFSLNVAAGNAAVTAPYSDASYKLVHVPFAATLAPGTYWISLVSGYNFAGGGQMGVATYGAGNANLANPGLGFGDGPVTSTAGIGGGGIAAYRLNGAAAVSAVPEPGTWAMMIGGIALMGGLLRRRRPQTALAIA